MANKRLCELVCVACALMSSACAPMARQEGREALLELKEPAVIYARTIRARALSSDEPARVGLIATVFEVRLEIMRVLAGRIDNRESDFVTVHLIAENPGPLAPGREIFVALDPALVADSRPLYWRPPTSFACIEKVELDRLKLAMSDERAFAVANDICVP